MCLYYRIGSLLRVVLFLIWEEGEGGRGGIQTIMSCTLHSTWLGSIVYVCMKTPCRVADTHTLDTGQAYVVHDHFSHPQPNGRGIPSLPCTRLTMFHMASLRKG